MRTKSRISSLLPSSIRPTPLPPVRPSLSSRSFSQSQCLLRRTRRRREMAQWLATIGYRNFAQPLRGSTNYLSAYGQDGVLLRAPGMTPGKAQPGSGNAVITNAQASGVEGSETTAEERAREETENRLRMASDGKPLPPETPNDLRPFRLNTNFISQPVLGEDLREAIYKMVVEEGKSVRVTSVYYNVTMERVAAVVRMKTMEREWVKQGKQLAVPYSHAVLSMLPKTRLRPGEGETAHEPINDLPVHPRTTRQIFYPTTESRHFTRADAGSVFQPRTPTQRALLPADARIPHPEMVELEKAGELSWVQRQRLKDELETKERDGIERRKKLQAEREAREVTVVHRRKVDFRFRDISVDAPAGDPRSRKGVGWRYGMPHEDRKPGQVKIPTSVP